MKKSLFLLLGLSFTFGVSASTPPLKLLNSDLGNIKAHSQTIKKWDCDSYREPLSTASCDYFKAYLFHQERKYDKAQQHVGKLSNLFYRQSGLPSMGVDQSFISQMVKMNIDMYGSALDSEESGGLSGMSVDTFMASLVGNDSHVNPYVFASYVSSAIDIFYDERKVKTIKQLYLILGEDLRDLHITQSGQSSGNASAVYQSTLSKLILGDQENGEHARLVNSLWKKIPASEKSTNLDILVGMYLQSGQHVLRSQELDAAFRKLNTNESNANDIKVRLYAIYLSSLTESIPESVRMPSDDDYSKVLIRYYHLLSPELKKQYKNSLNAAVKLVLSKPSPKSSIDELVLANYVMHRDVLNAPKYKDAYYQSMDKKYSVLMKDYMDFTDQSSKEYSVLSSLGALSNVPLGEGLM